ncbi:MAG: DUF559 domain-containing protein [Pseudomonadota bacterium]
MPKFADRKTDLARELRNNPTPAEKKLWPYLSARKLAGVRFNRQVCIGPYICDFASRGAGLVVELDGDSHVQQVSYDMDRTRFLEKQGYRVVRFANADVMGNVEGVVERIALVLGDIPSPNPSRKREGRNGQHASRRREGNI